MHIVRMVVSTPLFYTSGYKEFLCVPGYSVQICKIFIEKNVNSVLCFDVFLVPNTDLT